MSYDPLRPDKEAEALDTIAFDAVEANPDHRRVELELLLKGGGWETGDFLDIKPDFQHPVELRFGRTAETSPCLLVRGSECPQLRADYILFQPDVVATDPRKGWIPIGGIHSRRYPVEERMDDISIGRQATPQLRLGPDVSRWHAEISLKLKPTHSCLQLHAYSNDDRYARVSMHPDDTAEGSRELVR